MTDKPHDNRGPKERAFDEHIKPLMAKVLAFCREHKINVAAQFALDAQYLDDGSAAVLFSTIMLANADREDPAGIHRMHELRAVMCPELAISTTSPERN